MTYLELFIKTGKSQARLEIVVRDRTNLSDVHLFALLRCRTDCAIRRELFSLVTGKSFLTNEGILLTVHKLN